ncbi:DUF305 domain-containing protein [Actinomadura rubrisoli]|uniref:DUF305 domain-containing protein n=1 Tax=Actinomadura rubrisoli TaxID=2530368 RepID=A0A4R5B0P2_9ACTN|nr:DUF305 domain-containing protein [Actinomadura rubrisoli]TDD79538.1 DUF305 domain-containing protein [Actinomadura rubrisoli]
MKYGALALIAACVLLLFAQCGAAGGSSSAPVQARGGRGFNTTDVMFLQMMVPHQGQGVRLVRLARGHAVRPEIATLAAAIESTELSEIKSMAGRLRAWHRPATADPHSHAAHGGMPETSERELETLDRTPADRFERAFLNLLIAHQDDAVQMARMETGGGQDPWTRRLAQSVDRSRSAQITRMLAILGPHSPQDSPKK